MAQTVKNLPAMQETRVRSLGWKDPLEKGRQPPPELLSGESHGQRNPVGHDPWGYEELGLTGPLTLSLSQT